MKRRELITLLGGTAAWPFAARAQQAPMPVIGFMSARAPNDASRPLVEAFRRGLGETGYVEARNAVIEYYWMEGQIERLPMIATELARRPVSVIVAFSTVAARAVKAATMTVPVVFLTGDDPVMVGIVASLSRPSGNMTGVTFVSATLGAKRLELLREVVPNVETIAVLADPNSSESQSMLRDVQDAALARGQPLVVLNASTDGDIDAAFTALVQQRAGALVVAGSPFMGSRRDRLIALAARNAIPAIYQFRDFPAAGGLISYGASAEDAYRQVGVYAGRILKGDKPSDLPVLQPTKYELVINVKTAKALGLDVPDKLLALADEVIE
ncbi:MAG: ABC transporter substrate-binding protein [Xanthobacteraceae bacterium]